jgi:hypothetical protein
MPPGARRAASHSVASCPVSGAVPNDSGFSGAVNPSPLANHTAPHSLVAVVLTGNPTVPILSEINLVGVVILILIVELIIIELVEIIVVVIIVIIIQIKIVLVVEVVVIQILIIQRIILVGIIGIRGHAPARCTLLRRSTTPHRRRHHRLRVTAQSVRRIPHRLSGHASALPIRAKGQIMDGPTCRRTVTVTAYSSRSRSFFRSRVNRFRSIVFNIFLRKRIDCGVTSINSSSSMYSSALSNV